MARLSSSKVTLALLLSFIVITALAMAPHGRSLATASRIEATASPSAAPPQQRPRPALALTWSVKQTHTGVPVGLDIQSVDENSQPVGTAGTALIQLDDVSAEVSIGAKNQAPGAAQTSLLARGMLVTLAGGQGHLSVAFAAPGQHSAIAMLQDSPDVAGESDPLQVDPVFFDIHGPSSAAPAAEASFTITAHDDQGKPVTDYAGALSVTTSDPMAAVAAGSAETNHGQGPLIHRFQASEQGQSQIQVTFARGGDQTVELQDPNNGSLLASTKVTVTGSAAGGGAATPQPATATARATGTPSGTSTPAPSGTAVAGASVSPTASATVQPASTVIPPPTVLVPPSNPPATGTAAPHAMTVGQRASHASALYLHSALLDRTGAVIQAAVDDGAVIDQTGPSFGVTMSTTSTNAGVPLSMTVQALNNGSLNTAYTGTVQFTSTDAAFAPGTGFRYTFTSGDAGQHVFSVTFNTAGSSQTVTVNDTVTTTMTGTSPAVAVAETYLSGTWGAGSVQQSPSNYSLNRVNLTIQAKDGSGSLVTGYRGTVVPSASWGSVCWFCWGLGFVSPSYTFTANDGGQHVIQPGFTIPGNQTVTLTDTSLSARTVTTAPIAVTNPPATAYGHLASPAGLKLADGSMVYVYLADRGQLYATRNVGTSSEAVWRPLVLARDALPNNGPGADTPSLALLGSTIALFHTYSDGTYFQVWLTTSTDGGATWSSPVQITHENGHVQRIQTAVVGSTLYLFWSRQDTNQDVFYQTTTDLTNWTAKATVGQQIGVPLGNTTSNFGITHLASGSWLLGWIAPSAIGDPGIGLYPGDLNYPTVHVATSSDLNT